MDLDTIKLYEDRCRFLKSYFLENSITGDMKEYYGMLNSYYYFKDIMSYDSFIDVLKHKTSRRLKRYRANKKLTNLLDYRANNNIRNQLLVFTTLTLKNEVLYKKNGKPNQLRTITKKVDRYINDTYDYAIVNVDYGEKNQRLHFHLIGILKEDKEIIRNGKKSKKGFPMYDLKNDTNNLGFSNIEVINEENHKKITNYLLKINNHSNKPSTKHHRIRILGAKSLILDVKEYQVFLERLLSQK